MLKWLKTKPGCRDKITDDPLATIAIQNSRNIKKLQKNNEIYAVSRVNPLFEEEDVPKIPFSPGITSGSSGYDSGPSDDDAGLSGNSEQSAPSASPTRLPILQKRPQIFSDSTDMLITQEAQLLGPDGRPVLNILEQNPNYVKSIALSVPTQLREGSNGSRVSIPTRDAVGPAAMILHKDPRFVQSIRIGPKPAPPKKPPGLRVTRKPSVTFSEKVELVERRKPHEGDSIVTDSLLLMTTQMKRRLEMGERKAKDSELAAFSSSLRKNGPVKQVASRSSTPIVEEEPKEVGILQRSRSGASGRLSSPFGGIADTYACASTSSMPLQAKTFKKGSSGAGDEWEVVRVEPVCVKASVGSKGQDDESEVSWVSGRREEAPLSFRPSVAMAAAGFFDPYPDHESFYRRLSDLSDLSDAPSQHSNESLQVPLYHIHHYDDSDSGNSSDPAGGSGSDGDKQRKVMIVSGDRENVVVDLSRVPPPLREAIISGSVVRDSPEFTVVGIEEDGFGPRNKAQHWDSLQKKEKRGSGKGSGFPFHPNHDAHISSPDFTIEGARLDVAMRKVEVGKKRRCVCRLFGMFLFLAAFLGVLVALSLLYTRGEKFFGSV